MSFRIIANASCRVCVAVLLQSIICQICPASPAQTVAGGAKAVQSAPLVSIWSASIPSIAAKPVSDGKQIFQISGSTLVALDITKRAAVWRRNVGDFSWSSVLATDTHPQAVVVTTPTITSETVVLGVSRGPVGHVIAFDRKSGATTWDFDAGEFSQTGSTTRGVILSRPLQWHDRLIFRTGAGLTAISQTTGKEIWNVALDPSFPVPLVPSNDPASDDHTLYFNSDFGFAYAFDPRNGGHIWRTQTDGASVQSARGVSNTHITFAYCSPLLLSDRLMVSDGLGNVYALRSRDGVKIWRTSGSYVYGFVAVKGITYAATNTGLVALDSANGKVMRSFAVKGGVIQCAATKDHLVFAGSPSGIEVLDLLKWQVVASVPVVDARAGLAIVGTTLFTSVYTGSDRDPQTSELRAYHLPSD